MKKLLGILVLGLLWCSVSLSATKNYETKCLSDQDGKLNNPITFKFFKISPGNWQIDHPGNESRFNVYGDNKSLMWTFVQVFSSDTGFLFKYIFKLSEKTITAYMLDLDKDKIDELIKESGKLSASEFDMFKFEMIKKYPIKETYAGFFKNCIGSIHESKY